MSDTQRLSADETEPVPESESESNDHPYSPRSRLFDNDILRSTNTQPQASDILSEADYRKMRAATFSNAVVPGIVSAGVIAYFAPGIVQRIRPPGPSNPGKMRTGVFIVALTGIMSYLSYTSLSQSISSARQEAIRRSLPRTPDGGVILPDKSPVDLDHRGDHALHTASTSQDRAEDPLDKLGIERNRTRWAKGKGLDGEVEEEGEMRDTWLRPGVPRRNA